MKKLTNLKLIPIFTLSLFGSAAFANEQMSGQTVSQELEASLGVETIEGRTAAGEKCQVTFIPGCGYSFVKISTESKEVEISYSMSEQAEKAKGENHVSYSVKPVDAKAGMIVLIGDKTYKSVVLMKDDQSISCRVQ